MSERSSTPGVTSSNGTDDMDDVPYELDDDACSYCDGDGGDPLNDYVLPCPHCGGFNG